MFYWVLRGFTGFYRVFRGFYWVLLGFTGFYWVLPSFYWVVPSFTGSYWVLSDFTRFYRVSLVLTGFCHVLHDFHRVFTYRVLPSFFFAVLPPRVVSGYGRVPFRSNQLFYFFFITLYRFSFCSFFLSLPSFFFFESARQQVANRFTEFTEFFFYSRLVGSVFIDSFLIECGRL